ncbi:MAG: hypothetical protein ACNS62_19070 [Candidatus Cyclobacteriaceae bacterium M3_2C_046]
MKKAATMLLALVIFTGSVFTPLFAFTSFVHANNFPLEEENRRNFYVQLQEEEKQVFKLVVKGVKIEPIEVKIYDSNKNLIAKDFIDTDKSYTKVYNLSKVKTKKITFEIINREDIIAKQEF